MAKVRQTILAALFLLGLSGAALGGSLDDIRNRPLEPWISDLAHNHVAATRAWAHSDYEVWLIRKVQNHVEVWVIKLRDLASAADDTATLAGDDSFSLHIDAASKSIVGELYFQ